MFGQKIVKKWQWGYRENVKKRKKRKKGFWGCEERERRDKKARIEQGSMRVIEKTEKRWWATERGKRGKRGKTRKTRGISRKKKGNPGKRRSRKKRKKGVWKKRSGRGKKAENRGWEEKRQKRKLGDILGDFGGEARILGFWGWFGGDFRRNSRVCIVIGTIFVWFFFLVRRKQPLTWGGL